ncbi:NADPH-dependent F420 reductase [Bradyrhizobium sp. CSA207]|uniref:NADPH-dependent F420 reductase n=1 Tax=Bradyrhizobium sp. CSA207 TaxID=2698826 RepID=UPI0023B10007|nr:NADPH-dependent F420 reductase [Bradyrhizobium sp. CSA207]MDE5445772.1 NADPH-dependent F420 reductase [Bradyrhizobium sp. CSA207]
MSHKPSIAIIGGTGALGTGLARRWALAGYPITIGSRSAESATVSAQGLSALLSEKGVSGRVAGAENVEAARAADIVVLTVPFSQHAGMLGHIRESVQGRLVLDTTAPLVPPRVGTVQLPQAGSAAVSTQEALGDNVSVVSAFQTVAADKLQALHPMEGDVIVCGNKREDCARVIELVEATGMRGVYGGPLANSAASEALTSVLITINRQFKCQAGIKLVGLT